MDDFDLDAQLVARAHALRVCPDPQLRAIPALQMLAQCLSSSQGLTDALRHPDLDPGQIDESLRALGLSHLAATYGQAQKVAPPIRIATDDVDFRSWPGKPNYLALRSELEQASGEIMAAVYAMARQRWTQVEVLPADAAVLKNFRDLRKRLRLA